MRKKQKTVSVKNVKITCNFVLIIESFGYYLNCKFLMTNIGIDIGSYYFLLSKKKTAGAVEVLSNTLDKRLSPYYSILL